MIGRNSHNVLREYAGGYPEVMLRFMVFAVGGVRRAPAPPLQVLPVFFGSAFLQVAVILMYRSLGCCLTIIEIDVIKLLTKYSLYCERG